MVPASADQLCSHQTRTGAPNAHACLIPTLRHRRITKLQTPLHYDKVRFSERRINDTCFANVSKCVDSSSGDTDEIKEQRRQCIMKAKQQRDKEFADLPSPEDCEAASAGTDQEKPEAESGKEAPKAAKSAKAAKSPRKK